MKFGETPLDEAAGAILAHSVRGDGIAFKKGRVLSADDVDKLRSADVEFVVAATLEDGDVGEDDAAARIAQALLAGAAERAFPLPYVAGARAMGLLPRVIYERAARAFGPRRS